MGERRARYTTASADSDVSAALERLADLHDRGALTDEEYAAAKAQVLGGS